MTCGASVVIKVVVILRKLKATSNSSTNYFIFCSCSKILVGACKASSSI
jgi:hypothetical protein